MFYYFRLIPPVPLSIPFIGVYHARREDAATNYRLSHERPIWRIWQHGDQEFLAPARATGSTCSSASSRRRASPTRCRCAGTGRIDARGWALQDTIPIKIVGGRAEGFRGYGFKSNYQPGEWKVQVGTIDSREIGRVYFSLETRPEWPRTFEIEIQ